MDDVVAAFGANAREGLNPQVAAGLTAHYPLAPHARDEIRIDDDDARGRPARAACASGASFVRGSR